MKAIRYYGPGDMRVDDMPEPVTGDRQVKIKLLTLHVLSVCGSDLHSYFAVPTAVSPTLTKPHSVTQETLPIVMGHEFSGTIVEVGKAVTPGKFSVGQNVVVEPLISCGNCGPCVSGTRNLCRQISFIGIGGWGGGLAEYTVTNEELVHVLPENIPLEIGALIEPLAVSWHAVKISRFKPGSSVLIIGAGPIGLLLLKILTAEGASWIGVSEPATARRETAMRLNASAVFNPLSEDVVEATYRATNGGADVVFDCAGIQASFDAALGAVKTQGNVVEVAVWDTNPVINMNALQTKETILTASQAYDRRHTELLKMVAEGRIPNLEELITSKIALDDFVEKGIKVLIAEKDTQRHR
ncbi:alcohol dehydrogenase zinc-binding domain-containing protein [Daedalea quercina L-15889]|uniref:Alcohol dehydrogenase zinc-binding domain-containing protein n=1 Tax=Daedalea quercina L-15889 TaxID=1314783 RepID=A0A165LC78_9APHY|nr:alcohol dehydrogenase zinc-binding domain-containing protein [Daedalea quercina L-15889]